MIAPIGFLIWIFIGSLAGWLANKIMKRPSKSLISNILIGIVGAIIGGVLFSLLGASNWNSLIFALFSSTLGAVLLIWASSFLVKE